MLILALILFGMVIGGAAQLILGREDGRINWSLALTAGLIGSFVGGLLFSLLAGVDPAVRPDRLRPYGFPCRAASSTTYSSPVFGSTKLTCTFSAPLCCWDRT